MDFKSSLFVQKLKQIGFAFAVTAQSWRSYSVALSVSSCRFWGLNLYLLVAFDLVQENLTLTSEGQSWTVAEAGLAFREK